MKENSRTDRLELVAEFKLGDVVRLKSGGPRMVVVKPIHRPDAGPYAALCFWFTPSAELRQAEFLLETVSHLPDQYDRPRSTPSPGPGRES